MITCRIRHGAWIMTGLLLLAACATSAPSTPSTSPSPSVSTSASAAPTPTPTASTPTTVGQPAVWPGAGTTFATPAAAATDFVEKAIGVPALLGEFMQGDARSGEITLYFSGDGTTKTQRSLLLMRQLGASNGWYVLAAANDNQRITSPVQGGTVPAGKVQVTGVGRGFEATIVVTAVRPGDPTPLDKQIGMGGSMETPGPYTVTLDLSAARPGEVIAIVARGGVGHELDPGELGAIAVTISG